MTTSLQAKLGQDKSIDYVVSPSFVDSSNIDTILPFSKNNTR